MQRPPSKTLRGQESVLWQINKRKPGMRRLNFSICIWRLLFKNESVATKFIDRIDVYC